MSLSHLHLLSLSLFLYIYLSLSLSLSISMPFVSFCKLGYCSAQSVILLSRQKKADGMKEQCVGTGSVNSVSHLFVILTTRGCRNWHLFNILIVIALRNCQRLPIIDIRTYSIYHGGKKNSHVRMLHPAGHTNKTLIKATL